MKKLIQGIHHFQANLFSSQRELFERLARGQQPVALMITCSDSRINPNLITQTEPGELFIVRNAGNLVPAHGGPVGGEAATVEFAVVGLGIRDIIVCGHSLCGAMKALLDPDSLRQTMPAMCAWLGHAEATRRLLEEKYPDLSPADRLNVAIQENVLQQLDNLRTHPAVADRVARGELKLHGWVYKIETGEVFAYDPGREQFLPLAAGPEEPALAHGALVAERLS